MSKLGEDWLKLLKTGKFSDVTLLLGEDEVPVKCHQLVLVTRAPAVFGTKFSGQWKDKDIPKRIPDVVPAAFEIFLEYLYVEVLDMKNNASLLIDVVHIAKQFMVDSLVDECVKYVTTRLTMDEAIDMLPRAQGTFNEIFEATGAFITINFADLLLNDNLTKLEESHWIYLLKREDLVLGDFEVFNIVHKWALLRLDKMREDGDTNMTVKELLRNIVRHICFVKMRPDQFVDFVIPSNVLEREMCLDILCYFHSAVGRGRFPEGFPFEIFPRNSRERRRWSPVQPEMRKPGEN